VTACQALRQSDEMVCAPCRLRWDVDDPDPPLCGLQVATRAHDEDVERANRYVSALAPAKLR
jgi:hypothetical protein